LKLAGAKPAERCPSRQSETLAADKAHIGARLNQEHVGANQAEQFRMITRKSARRLAGETPAVVMATAEAL
jgi:hypothetical protein